MAMTGLSNENSAMAGLISLAITRPKQAGMATASTLNRTPDSGSLKAHGDLSDRAVGRAIDRGGRLQVTVPLGRGAPSRGASAGAAGAVVSRTAPSWMTSRESTPPGP